MDQYQLKRSDVKATQWWKMGDHPDVEQYSHPDVDPDKGCTGCVRNISAHGCLTRDGEMCMVCPGDYIVMADSVLQVNKQKDFEETYELVETKPTVKPELVKDDKVLLARGKAQPDPEALPVDEQTG